MGHGRLKEVPAIAKKQVEKTEDERLFGKWMNLLYGALNSGQTYSQLRRRFHDETGEWPRGQWLGVFPPDSLDWARKPAESFTKQSLFLAGKRSRQ